MNVSNLVITGETMAKANKPLSNRKKGELRTQKLKELAESGKLSMIRTRGDLAEAVGYTYSQRGNAGYQWVHYKIEKGELKETLVGYTENGSAEYEYQYLGKKTTTPSKEATESALAMYDRLKQDSIEQSMAELNSPMVTIYKGDITISLEFMSEEGIAQIIKSIMES